MKTINIILLFTALIGNSLIVNKLQMEKKLLTLIFILLSFCSFSQTKESVINEIDKQLSDNYHVKEKGSHYWILIFNDSSSLSVSLIWEWEEQDTNVKSSYISIHAYCGKISEFKDSCEAYKILLNANDEYTSCNYSVDNVGTIWANKQISVNELKSLSRKVENLINVANYLGLDNSMPEYRFVEEY